MNCNFSEFHGEWMLMRAVLSSREGGLFICHLAATLELKTPVKKRLSKLAAAADNQASAALCRPIGKAGASQTTMQNENQGRIIEMAAAFAPAQRRQKPTNTTDRRAGKTLIMDPRTIRHQERVEDLFYLLFRRTSA